MHINEHFFLRVVRPLFFVIFNLWQVILVLLPKNNLFLFHFKKKIKQAILDVPKVLQVVEEWLVFRLMAPAVSTLPCMHTFPL